jgi:hypothetical protein
MSNHSLRSRPSSRSHSACSNERSKNYKSGNPKLSYCDPKIVFHNKNPASNSAERSDTNDRLLP